MYIVQYYVHMYICNMDLRESRLVRSVLAAYNVGLHHIITTHTYTT